MLCKIWSIPKKSRMLRSVFCDASCVLIWISSIKDESSFRGILYISISASNSRLSLVTALKVLSNAEGLSSKLNKLFMIFNPPNFSVNVFAAKISPVRLLVRDCQLLSSKSCVVCFKSVLPVFEIFLIINQSISARLWSLVTLKCLYNVVIFSRFTFCLNCRVYVA